MKRNEYTILKRQIPDVNLHSVTGSYWFDNQDDLFSWCEWEEFITYNINDVIVKNEIKYKSLSNNNKGNKVNDKIYWVEVNLNTLPTNKRGFLPTGYTPYSGYVVNNVTGSLPTGSYIWNGTSWSGLTGSLNQSYNLPIVLEADADEMGVMSSFDGNMEQVDQIVNFSYKQSGSTITVYGTMNPDKLRKIVDQSFTINWGDGTTGMLDVNKGVLYSNLPTTSHTYSTNGQHLITISLDSPWSKQKTQKIVTTPQDITVSNPLGTFSGFKIPYTQITGSLDYINESKFSSFTGSAILKYMAIGGSKIGELRKYGQTTLSTSSYVTGTFSGSLYTGYTLETGALIVSNSLVSGSVSSGSLWYMDFADGYTMITGKTSNFTKEEVINNVITRNEHFIGFIDDPTVYSDIFVERGRQGVMEPNLRLGEIDNMSELDVYGNGYFKVRKK